jgi:hypothetical protein
LERHSLIRRFDLADTASDKQRRSIWGKPLDIITEPFIQKYDSMGKKIQGMNERAIKALVPVRAAASNLPALVATSGEQAARCFVDFFTSNIRNRNTREAYGRAVRAFWPGAKPRASPR